MPFIKGWIKIQCQEYWLWSFHMNSLSSGSVSLQNKNIFGQETIYWWKDINLFSSQFSFNNNNNIQCQQFRVVKVKEMLRSTWPLLPVDVHLLHHPRPPLSQLSQWRAAQWPLSLQVNRGPQCSKCSRSRIVSHQYRNPRVWTQWQSYRRENIGIALSH